MNIKGLAFDDGKITSYLFSLAGKKILFDFGSNDISDDQLQTIDYVFISHYHYDHICGLLNRMHLLSSNCKIYMSRTTYEIFNLQIHRGNERAASVYNKMMKFYNENIHLAFFNKEYNEDGLTFKFYRSGHCFGGYMLYIKDSKTSLFFSSDMDYHSAEIDRQYYVNDTLDVDFAILDGTIINDSDFKGNKITSIKFNNKKDMYLQCKAEKAVFIARFLAKKYPEANIVYDRDLEDYIYVFLKNGYDCFNYQKQIFTRSLIESDPKLLSNNKSIYLSTIATKNTTFFPDHLFSLHIGQRDRKRFIEKTFALDTQILIGHYSSQDNVDEYCKNNNYFKIKRGENNYGRKK